MKLIKNILGFSICFLRQFYWKKSKQDTLWIRHFWIPMISGHHTSSHICNHIYFKRFAKWFSENEGERVEVWNFSKNSSDLVAPPFPQSNVVVGIEEDLRLKCSFTGRIGDMRTARQWGTDNMLCQYATGNSKAKSLFTSQNWREATRSGCERLWTPRALVGATLIMTALELSDFPPLKATRTLSLTSQSRRTGLDSCPRWKSSLMMRNPQGDNWPTPIYW